MTTPPDAPTSTGLLTEFYQLVQTALYHADGMWGDATVDLYLRELTPEHGYMVVAGVEAAVQAVLDLRFSDDDIDWVQSQPMYAGLGDTFFESLRHFEFKGDIWAIPEGTPVFPGEPILRITAPLPQVGLFEMIVIQAIAHASGIATSAARITQAAQGRSVLDFGTRRSPGREVANAAARAAFIGGCAGTTHALAARDLGIPVVGLVSDTMLAAYEDVAVAYDALRAHFPDGCHLNLPTDAPLDAIERFEHIQEQVQTVRIDHPDLDGVSRDIRGRLDARGMQHTRILGGGNLDAPAIEQLVNNGAPIDMFAVGSALLQGPGTLPPLSYRMSALVRGVEHVPVTGHWSAKWPGVKNVVRFDDHDCLCLEVEVPDLEMNGGTAILKPWIIGGEAVFPMPSLRDVREHCSRTLAAIPSATRALESPESFPVRPSSTVAQLAT